MTSVSALSDPTGLRAHLRVAMLDQWMAAGIAMVEKVASEAGRGLGHGMRALLRIFQAVRLAAALATRLSNPNDPAFRPNPVKSRAPKAETPPETSSDPRGEKPAAARQGRNEFGDGLAADRAILRRPLVEIVKVICDALGVTPDWSLWSDAVETPDDATPDDPGRAPVPPRPPFRASPDPRPRPGRLPDRPKPPPIVGSLMARLRRSCAPGALIPHPSPLASGRLRLA
jgi:hypothetical protein